MLNPFRHSTCAEFMAMAEIPYMAPILSNNIKSLSLSQRGSYRIERKVFNSLPTYVKDVSFNGKGFKRLLKIFLYSYSFCRLEEYFQYNNNNNNNNNIWYILFIT
jgi:hypothetical protein